MKITRENEKFIPREKTEPTEEKVNIVTDFLKKIGVFLGKGFVLGRWEIKFTWKF